MKRALIAITLLASLTGCAHQRYAPIHCLTPQQLEKLKSDKPPKIGSTLTGRADEDVKRVTGQLIRMEGYADGLLGVLGGCTG